MQPRRRIAIVGATSAIAEHCARLWAVAGPCDFVLVGRDAGRLDIIAQDLRVRSPAGTAQTVVADLVDVDSIRATVAAVASAAPVDIALIAHGSLPDQTGCQADLQRAAEALTVNGLSPVLFAEAFAGAMQSAGHGTIAIIGSVAGDRGRRSNYVYGAAKGLVARYAQGMQHRFARAAVKVVLIEPGPTDTPMTGHLKAAGARLAPVEDVAARIVAGVARGTPIVYAPAKWRVIMMIIRHLPRVVFDRLDI